MILDQGLVSGYRAFPRAPEFLRSNDCAPPGTNFDFGPSGGWGEVAQQHDLKQAPADQHVLWLLCSSCGPTLPSRIPHHLHEIWYEKGLARDLAQDY